MCATSANLYDNPLDSLNAAQWFERAAPLYPLAATYQRQQYKRLLAIADGDTASKRHLGHLARACCLIARQPALWQSALSKLALTFPYQSAAEALARVIYNYQHYDPELIEPEELPFKSASATALPAALVRALLTWPDDDKRLRQALHALEKRPLLADTLCRYATSYTEQGHTLPLKSSLLLIGPQRSRELVLLAHLESAVLSHDFPLRSAILERQRLLGHVIHYLADDCQIALPCRAELISCLLIADAWRHPRWSNASRWQRDPRQPLTSLNHWLYSPRPLTTSLAARLCRYWQLPPELQTLFSSQRLSNGDATTQTEALIGAAIAAVSLASSVSPSVDTSLNACLRLIGYTAQEQFFTHVQQIACKVGYFTPCSQELRP